MSASAQSATYYEILEVDPNASQAVIRAAYKSLMQFDHPDKNSGNPEIARQTILLSNAFEVLSDPEKRRTYDLELERNSLYKSNSIAKPASVEYGVMTTQQKEQ